MARLFVHNGYIPLRHGQRIDAVNDETLFWGFNAALLLGFVAAVVNFLLSIANEYRERSISNSCEDESSFMAGKYMISYSSIWLFPVLTGLIVAWGLYVVSSGEIHYGSWFLGHWASGILVLLFGTFISGWSLRVSQSGSTLLFKRLSMVTGNLPLPVSSSEEQRNVLVFRARGAQYSVPLRKLSERNRVLLQRVFIRDEEKR